MPRRKLIVGILVLFGAAACGGGNEPELRPTAIGVVSGTGQQGPAGFRLAEPLVVVVSDQFGKPLARAQINWSVTSGAGAAVSPGLSVTNGLGKAATELTLGPTAGSYAVRATVATAPQLTAGFTVTATDPPTLSAVSPATFRGGDTLALTGTGFTATAQVEVGGLFARVVSASGMAMQAVAPACLAPGSVGVRVRVGPAVTDSLVRTYTADSIGLLVGEYTAVDPAQVATCATFGANAGLDTIEYVVMPQAATGRPDQIQTYRLQSGAAAGSGAPGPGAPVELALAEQFHLFLRKEEERLSRLPRPAARPQLELAAPEAAPPAVGSTKKFVVCATLTCSRFDTVTATVKFSGAHAVIYQDNTAPASGFSAADFDSLGNLFDQRLYEVDADAFGAESDIDRNGVVIILLTATVNRLVPEPQCQTSFVAGFFFPFDLDPTAADDPRSNRGEIFYTLVPDPSGAVTCAYSTTLMKRLVPVTFIHELQHMISYNEHVLVRNSPSEILWLNEGLSHFAEELGGRTYPPGSAEFSRFVIGDLFDAYKYLEVTGATFLAVQSNSLGTLAERGAAWLFVRYLVDRFGPGVTRRLVQTSLRGEANVEAAIGQPMRRLVGQWALANWVSDLPSFTAPDELRYSSWQFRQTYQSLNSQDPNNFPQPYPLVPAVQLTPSFGPLSASIRSGSGVFYRVKQPPAASGFALTFTDGSGAPFSPANPAVPRLNVIRIR